MSDWASHYVEALLRGETVKFRPRGGSMRGRVESGQLCTVAPVDHPSAEGVAAGDVVLCRVRGRTYLHLVQAVGSRGFCIGSNRGVTNGWAGPAGIFGKLVTVED